MQKPFIFLFPLFIFFFASLDCRSQSEKSDILFAKGMDAYEKGDYSMAIEWFSKAKKLDDVELKDVPTRRLYSTKWLAHCLFLNGDEQRARELLTVNYKVQPVDRRLTVESDREYELAFGFEDRQEYELSLVHALKGIALEEEALGASFYVCDSWLFIGNLYLTLRNTDSALQYYSKALDCLRNLNVDDHTLEFQILQGRIDAYLDKGMLAMTMFDLGRMEEIASYEEEDRSNPYPMAIAKITALKVELHRASDLDNLVEMARETFNYILDLYNPDEEQSFFYLKDCIDCFYLAGMRKEAYVLMSEAMPKLRKKNISKKHKGCWLTLMSTYASDIETARKHLKEGAELLKDVGEMDEYYSNLNYQALMLQEENEIDKAIDLYMKVLDFLEKGNQSPQQSVSVLTNLGHLYESHGQIEKALECFRKALSLLQDDKTDPHYVLTFMQYFTILSKAMTLGLIELDESLAENTVREMNDILCNTVNSNFLSKGIGIFELSNALLPFFRELIRLAPYLDVNTPNRIDYALSGIVESLRNRLSIDNPVYSEATSLLASSKYNVGDFSTAISYLNEVIGIARKMNWEHRHYLHDLAIAQYKSGDHAGAFENFKSGFEFLRDETTSRYLWMTLDERSAFNDYFRGSIDELPRLAAMTPEDLRYASLAYDILLFNKGLLLNSSIEFAAALDEIEDEETKKILSDWRKINQKLYSAEKSGKGYDDEMKKNSVRLEKQLMEKSKEFGDYTKNLIISFKEVQKNLHENDAAIELFSYSVDTDSKHYGALVLTHRKNPVFVDLGSESELGLLDIDSEAYMEEGIFDTLFGNLKEFLPSKDKGILYISPDGIFHLIPFENLPGSESYTIHRVSSTRQLAMNNGVDSATSMVLFGGIDYGLGEVASYYEDTQTRKRTSSDFLAYLPGTLDEVSLIKENLDKDMNVDLLTGRKATKTNFISYSGKRPHIIHIATHGFFFDPHLQVTEDLNPMTCSGLYFAGAQNTLWDMDTQQLNDNGILTAQEISALDLRGVRLAVLSACETGRGSITPDGVFGLQRGFKQAGIRSLMISLWKVDDEVTKLLMTRFYESLLLGLHPLDALKSAQSKVRETFPNSKDWGAFVLLDALNPISIPHARASR